MKIHVEGYSDKIKLADELSENYNLPNSFGTEDDVFEETLETIPNVKLQIYSSDNKKSLEKVKEDHLKEILGDVTIEGSLNGYSEYTIMGFDISRMWIGGHDIQNIINSYIHKYLHIILEWDEKL